MDSTRLAEILERFDSVRLAVVGDLCLDMYMELDPDGSEHSVETGLMGEAVRRCRYWPGGAANVAANLAALKPSLAMAVGVVGDDPFGRELLDQLTARGVDTDSIVVQPDGFDTVTLGKRILGGQEQARVDFGFFNKRSEATDKAVLAGLRRVLESCDAVVLNQQVPGSLSRSFVDGVNDLLRQFPDRVVVLDSRHYGGEFTHVWRKINEEEAARLAGGEDASTTPTRRQLHDYAKALFEHSGRPVFITRGPRGLLVADGDGVHEVCGIQVLKKTDPVGAGDTVAAVTAACLGASATPLEAARVANFAAAVTVQKLLVTGTASRREIAALAESVDYIYRPELAEDPRGACTIEGTEIERATPAEELTLGRIRHAVFDHDGTISVLRQGWEAIMEPVMIKAILGSHVSTVDPSVYREVVERSRAYIDRSTGIQTILQMEALVEMVREAGYVPEEEILDKVGYKKVYNDALMEMVNRRIEKLERGQLAIEDYTVKGAVEFLNALKQRGIVLYLASGTDRDDVADEARRLGYAELFDGGIYGSVGDVSKYSKKMVIEKIMTDHNLHGSQLVVFGDGPVELRECKRRGGIAVGLASDEVRRYGLNVDKRTRLIKAGADLVVPDFSQLDELLKVLGV